MAHPHVLHTIWLDSREPTNTDTLWIKPLPKGQYGAFVYGQNGWIMTTALFKGTLGEFVVSDLPEATEDSNGVMSYIDKRILDSLDLETVRLGDLVKNIFEKKVNYLKDKDGYIIFPVTHEDAVIDTQGKTLTEKLADKQDTLESGINIKTINNQSILGGGNITIDTSAEPQISITWSELKELQNSGELVPGCVYRITDYVATTTDVNTRSANHPFDIITKAIDECTLSEECLAALHHGDTYFANSNLAAWKIWYRLDNDTATFDWADPMNGKGVVYRMIDEWNNDLAYDFKSIQFKRYKVTPATVNEDILANINGMYLGCVASKGVTIDTSDFNWYYTFSRLTSNLTTAEDASVIDTNCSNNILPAKTYSSSRTLNNVVFMGGAAVYNDIHTKDSSTGITGNNIARNNEFKENPSNITIFGNSVNNFCKSQFRNTIIFGNFRHNIFGTDVQNNTFIATTDFSYNSFGDKSFSDCIFSAPTISLNTIENAQNCTYYAGNRIRGNNIHITYNSTIKCGIALIQNALNCEQNNNINCSEFSLNRGVVFEGNTFNALSATLAYNDFGDRFINNTISAAFNYNFISSAQFVRNTISANFIGNSIKYNFADNTITGAFQNNEMLGGQVTFCTFNAKLTACAFSAILQYVIFTANTNPFLYCDIKGGIRGTSSSRVILDHSSFYLSSAAGVNRRVTIEGSSDGKIIATWKDNGIIKGVMKTVGGTWTDIPDIDDKQDVLVSGTNIKTVNNQSLLGPGNIEITSGTQSDWNETSVSDPAYIKNKPNDLVHYTDVGQSEPINVPDYATEDEVSQLRSEVDDYEGVCAIANGSNGNSGNTFLVHTGVISTKGARYAIIKINRPNEAGYHYAYGWALTSSKADIGTTTQTNQWVGLIIKKDVAATATNFILDMDSYPNAVGVSFTIGEYDAQGNYRTLRRTDFAEGDVIVECQPGIDNLITEKLHRELWGLDIISFEGVRGYINGSGGANTSDSYRTRYIDRSYFSGTQLIVGQCSFVHFFDGSKNWLSCFASWSSSRIIEIKDSDIPSNCAYVVICCLTATTNLKLYNKDEYLSTQRLSPTFPFMRNGSARYSSTSNNICTAMIFPAYGAQLVRFTILKSPASGLHYEISISRYQTVSQLTTLDVPVSSSGSWIATTVAEADMSGYEGVAFGIRKCDVNGNLQSLDDTEFAVGEVLAERIFVPSLLLPVMNNDAYARNRDREAMLAAAVRANKKSEGSSDFMNLILTDSHGDSLSESNAVVIADNFPLIQSLIHCGDFCADDATNFNADRYNRLLSCKKPFYFVAGNHDVGNSNIVAKCITNAQYYDRYVQPLVSAGFLSNGEYSEGAGYYYHDFTDKKIRLIAIYEYDDPNDLDPSDNTKYRYRRGDSIISKAQAEWFCGVLDDTPADYGIIVAMHNPFSQLADCVTSAKFNDPDWVDGYGAQRLFSTDLWADIVNAWVNKSPDYHCSMVCTGNASYLNQDGEYYSFDHDFSGRNNTAKFICFIGGHVHRDCVWRHRTYRHQYQVTPVCSNSTYLQSPGSDIRRTSTDGLAKDSLTAIGYDYDNQDIRLVKLGVNVTEKMKPRDYELIKTQEL